MTNTTAALRSKVKDVTERCVLAATVGERVCVGDREGARRGEWFSHESFLQAPPRTMAPSPRSLFVSRFSVNKTNGRTRFRLRLWPT